MFIVGICNYIFYKHKPGYLVTRIVAATKQSVSGTTCLKINRNIIERGAIHKRQFYDVFLNLVTS